MTPEELEQERVKFEAWALSEWNASVNLTRHTIIPAAYSNQLTHAVWNGWLAAKEDARREIEELKETYRHDLVRANERMDG